MTDQTLADFLDLNDADRQRAAARALTELGCPAVFVGAVAWAAIGPPAPWFGLAAVVLETIRLFGHAELRSVE